MTTDELTTHSAIMWAAMIVSSAESLELLQMPPSASSDHVATVARIVEHKRQVLIDAGANPRDVDALIEAGRRCARELVARPRTVERIATPESQP